MSEFEAKKRDWFLTEAVYQEQMDYWPRSNFFKPSVIEKLNDLDRDKDYRQGLSWDRCYDSLEHVVLRYSAGEEIDSLRDPCIQAFEEFARHYRMFPDDKMLYWEPDAYQYLMWLLGLAYLFNLPEYVPQIATWYAHNTESPQDDKLVCALFTRLGCKEFNNPADWLVNDKPYAHLYLALQAGEEGQKAAAQKHLEAYLKSWYKGMKDCYWHDRHKGKFATHFGYWSFESGLVSLLCGLDDADYRDMLYYPKDLVDYARPNAFQPIASPESPKTLRAMPGECCPKTGDWYALHLGGKTVRVNEGDPMPGPEFGSTGLVIWHLKCK